MDEENLAKICKSLGDPIRLKIFEMLKEGTKCACVLLKAFKISQPTLSYHMKYLLASGIVTCEKSGKWCNYSIDKRKLSELLSYLSAVPEQKASGNCSAAERK
jgi:ArsR family transcriptional regulator, arsenate/arsenite/antimonite-responsive transcriptional repressor